MSGEIVSATWQERQHPLIELAGHADSCFILCASENIKPHTGCNDLGQTKGQNKCLSFQFFLLTPRRDDYMK